jgi:DNA-binding CsgD family transcriptional regulator
MHILLLGEARTQCVSDRLQMEVDDDPSKRDRVSAALRDPAQKDNRDYVDIIVALGMARARLDLIEKADFWPMHISAGQRQRLALARASLTESAQLSLATGQRLPVARGLTALGVLALAERDPERAIRLEGAAMALRAELGKAPAGPASQRLDGFFADARQRLGDQAAGRLLAEGRALGATAAVRYGISEPGADPPGTGPPGADGPVPPEGAAIGREGAVTEPSVLTPRELQTAVLVARGLSNRAIAEELVISPATAARHVANIFTKLGFTSRAQLAAWVAGQSAPRAS